MFTHTKTGTDRLAVWRDFRYSNPDINKVVSAFSSIKPQPRYIDYYTPESWPTPFEIVEEGLLCQSGITLVMTATLYNLSIVKSDQITLEVISNHITGTEGLVLLHQNKFYNFLPGKIKDVRFVRDNSTCFERHVVPADKFK